MLSYADTAATVPSGGICSAIALSVTTVGFPASPATFTLGNLGAASGQVGQNGWFTGEESLSGSPIVAGHIITNTQSFTGSNSYRMGYCNTRCTAINFLSYPGYASNAPQNNGIGWITSGWAGKPSSGAPADRIRFSYWIRSAGPPIVPDSTTDAANFPLPNFRISLTGASSDRMTSFALRISGTNLIAYCGGFPSGDANVFDERTSNALTVGAWYQMVTTAAFIDGQFNDKVTYQVRTLEDYRGLNSYFCQPSLKVYFSFFSIFSLLLTLRIVPSMQVFDNAGNNVFDQTTNSWEGPFFSVCLGLAISTRPAERPPAGSMFLFRRSASPRFRYDGYDWKGRESHTKLKVGEEAKLNCYYLGNPEDSVQQRSYWLIDDSKNDLVLVHYQPPLAAKQLLNPGGVFLPEGMHNTIEGGAGSLIQVRRLSMQDRLGKSTTINTNGGFFVDNIEITTWNSANPTNLLYSYSTGFESVA